MTTDLLLTFGVFGLYWLAYSVLAMAAIRIQKKNFSFGWIVLGGLIAAGADLNVVRLSVGIESIDDIIQDIDQALAKV